MSAMRGLHQIRAERALAAMRPPATENQRKAGVQLAQMLRQNGLLAAWAFCQKKGKQDYQRSLDALREHLQAVHPTIAGAEPHSRILFCRWVGNSGGLDGSSLRTLTAEAIAFGEWLKRAAQAFAEE